jgi:hypothetical protein
MVKLLRASKRCFVRAQPDAVNGAWERPRCTNVRLRRMRGRFRLHYPSSGRVTYNPTGEPRKKETVKSGGEQCLAL